MWISGLISKMYHKGCLYYVGILSVLCLLLATLCALTIFMLAIYNPAEHYQLASETAQHCSEVGSHTALPIPKHIHQIWHDHNIPEKWTQLSEKCKKLNLHYKYTLWTEEDIDLFISREYPWYLETFKSYTYQIQRIDAVRYFILYKYGGIYIDFDIECRETFDNILKNISQSNKEAILGATAPLGLTNSMMMSKVSHPFMEFTIKRLQMTNHWYILPYWTVMLATGPLFLYRNYLLYPCNKQIHILTVHQHTEQYFHHFHAGAWHTWDGPIMVWFDNHGCIILYCLVVAAFFIIVYLLLTYKKHLQGLVNYFITTRPQPSSAQY